MSEWKYDPEKDPMRIASGEVNQSKYDPYPHEFIADLKRQLATVTAERDALRVDAERYRHGFESVISRLSHIHGLMWPEPFEADGKHFKFHPPEELVRETWEGLSKAIREIPAAIDAARAK